MKEGDSLRTKGFTNEDYRRGDSVRTRSFRNEDYNNKRGDGLKTRSLRNEDYNNKRGDSLRTRSFRNEDYNNRRAFLTSYPLHFDDDEHHQETQAQTTTGPRSDRADTNTSEVPHVDKNEKENMKLKMKEETKKKTIVELVGGRVVALRRFKCKVSFHVFACFPIVFKPSKPLFCSSLDV